MRTLGLLVVLVLVVEDAIDGPGQLSASDLLLQPFSLILAKPKLLAFPVKLVNDEGI